MKAIATAGLLLALTSSSAIAVDVDGYYRKDGTYVERHQRTSPDSNPYNNYSYPGNYNPNSGTITPGDSYRHIDRYNQNNNNNGSGGFLGGTVRPSPWRAR